MRFYQKDDQKRSLLSILMQRSIIRHALKVSENEYVIRRTRENKPYAISSKKAIGRWNYNVSHHGDFVAIASHPHLIVGVDLVTLSTRSSFANTFPEFLEMFSEQLTQTEMQSIMAEKSESMQYQHFFIIWSLKESFIKAIGAGLSYDLKCANFTVEFSPAYKNGLNPLSGTAALHIAGQERKDWRFVFFSLDENHVVSIALGK